MDDYGKVKMAALQNNGTWNCRFSAVKDELFVENEFFDPQDLVQVKYEMLRRVHGDGMSVSMASHIFGFSRVAYYQILSAFEADGVAGLLPRQRGPRHAHKLNEEVIAFVTAQQAGGAWLSSRELVYLVRKKFGITVHPRSIERAIKRLQKKG